MIPHRHRFQRRAAPVFEVLLALAAVLLVLLPASAARAHASLLSSDPEDGAVLDQAPSAITLSFNEPVQPVADAIQLFDQDGGDHPVSAIASDHDVVIDVRSDLEEGQYTLSWRVISADAHPISGVVSFTVGTGVPAPVDQDGDDEGDRIAIMTIGALHYLGLLVFGGFVFFRIVIAREMGPQRPRHRLLRLSGTTAIMASAAAIPIDSLAAAGLPLSRIADVEAWGPTGRPEAAAIALLTAAGLGSAYWWFTHSKSTSAAPLALGSAAVAAAAPILVGHSMLFGPRWLMISADAVHVFAGAIWTGGLIGLLMLLHQAGRRGENADGSGPATVVARFSAWAGITVGLLAASGLTMAVMIHREWAGLFGSDHGRGLLVKLGLVAVALALAAWNRFRLVPAIRREAERRLGLRRLHRILVGEAAAVGLAIAVTGTLVNLNPGAEAQTETSVITQRHELGDGEVEAVLSPSETGRNTLTLELTDAEGLPLEPLEDPMALASLPEQDFGPITAEALPEPGGGYRAELDLPLSGRWEIEIHVRVSEFEHHIATITVNIP